MICLLTLPRGPARDLDDAADEIEDAGSPPPCDEAEGERAGCNLSPVPCNLRFLP